MANRSSKKRKHDFAITAFEMIQEATKESEEVQPQPEQTPEGRNSHAIALGRLGGKKGRPARAKKLTLEQGQETAK